MSYANAINELRQLLADTNLDKKATKKRILGDVDGNNVEFYTYDKRIFSDTVLVYVNNAIVTASVDDEIQGQITLAAPPDINSKVEASYYWRFFNDDELQNFLNKGAEACGTFGDNIPDNSYLSIIAGMRTAAIYFAASMCKRRLISLLMNRAHSEEFLVEQDGNDDNKFSQTINAMNREAKELWDQAIWHRDDYYLRQGKRNAPSFGVKTGTVRKYGAIR